MQKHNLFPVIYGIISALISFIAVAFICLRTFNMNTSLAVIVAGLVAIAFFYFVLVSRTRLS